MTRNFNATIERKCEKKRCETGNCRQTEHIFRFYHLNLFENCSRKNNMKRAHTHKQKSSRSFDIVSLRILKCTIGIIRIRFDGKADCFCNKNSNKWNYFYGFPFSFDCVSIKQANRRERDGMVEPWYRSGCGGRFFTIFFFSSNYRAQQ